MVISKTFLFLDMCIWNDHLKDIHFSEYVLLKQMRILKVSFYDDHRNMYKQIKRTMQVWILISMNIDRDTHTEI